MTQAFAIRESLALRAACRTAWVLLAVLGLLLCADTARAEDDRPQEIPYDTPGGVPELNSNYKMTNHKVVVIENHALKPRLATLEEGQLVAWISYSSVPSEVVFEREVARAMVCHSLVNFSIKDDELRSAPIHAGEFASFCQLKPGRYRYKIVRQMPTDSGSDAARRIDGEIIVGNPKGGG
jgi:hypothetical protein